MAEFSQGPKVELPHGLALRSTLQVQAGNINEIAWSPDGETLASGDPDGVIGLWDVASGIQRARLERTEKVVWSIAFSPDGARVASGSNDGTVGIFDSETGKLIESLERHESWVRSVAFSPDGVSLASGANDRRIFVWDLATRSRRLVLDGHRERVLSLRFSPDGSKIASAGGDGLVMIWDATTGESLARHQITGGWQRGVCWSPDGRLVASGGEDGAVRLLRCSDGRLSAVLEGHREGVGCVSFDASGLLLASRSVDGRVRIWTPSRGSWRLLARFKEPASFPMANMAFHPHEPVLATVAQARIRLWHVDLESLRSAAEGQSAARLVSTKVAAIGGAAAAELVRALAAPLHGETHPPVHLLEAREEVKAGVAERREILLHDLSGADANGYARARAAAAEEHRALAALNLRDAHAVLVVFDPATDADPGEAIRYHASVAARVARLEKRPDGPVFFAVSTRPLGRRGEDTSVASGRLDLSLLDLPLAGLLVAQPDSPRQLQRLREALLDSLDEAPPGPALDSASTLAEIETLIREEKRNGRQLTTAEDLFRFYLGREQQADERTRAIFDACLRQLELRGQLRRLRLGQLIAFPETVDSYARALLRKAAGHPRGALREEEALEGWLEIDGGLAAPELDRLLRMAVVGELIDLGIAHKTPHEGETWLAFPELARARPAPPAPVPAAAELPPLPEAPPGPEGAPGGEP